MKKLLVISAALFLIACSGKKTSPEYNSAVHEYSSFVERYLRGSFKAADFAFYKSVDAFVRLDSFCNASRVYIGRYVIEAKRGKDELLNSASKYASLDNCTVEERIISFLSGDNVTGELPQPYSGIKDLHASNPSPLESYASKEDTPPESASRIYRMLARHYTGKDTKKAEEMLESARRIDSYNGWTLNLFRDNILLADIYEKAGRDNKHLLERARLLELKLDNN
ncbi:hypothetical protein [Limisalsivibrio acetivorans]|uniref:hypothetical protein n=1 Tax=Limisalsivibrio acetivorans TaxID=1304888 RepID=UPI0003B3CBE3|nr:hypothetical protein [Limisalsivibrio acetivorans]